MIKIKCTVCRHWHGGFHLCVGPDAPPELRKGATVYPSNAPNAKANGPRTRWEQEWATNLGRDRNILKDYMEEGKSLQTCADKYGVNKQTVKSIVLRLGGTIRPKNMGRYTHIKENA